MIAGALRRAGSAARNAWAPSPGASGTTAEYLYVPCVRTAGQNGSAETRRWVQPVPIVKKTAKLIFYTSDSWDRRQAVVSPGCISYEQIETGSGGQLFFATRQGAEDYLWRRIGERARPAPPAAPSVQQLRRAMVNAHPDRGGLAEQFIQAHCRYQTALRSARS
jgi:hypothetical protein